MKSLVLDLQEEAYNSKGTVTDLVNKAYFVARKLKVREFEEWLNKELKGYSNDTVPDYRYVIGEIKALNPQMGWIQVLSTDKRVQNIRFRPLYQSIGELESLSHEDHLTISLPDNIVIGLGEMCNFKTSYKLFLSTSQVIKIINHVKSIIVDWSFKLQDEGIMGEGLKSFTQEEQRKAEGISTQITNNFYGDVKQSQLQQNSPHASQSFNIENLDIKAVRDLLRDVKDSQDKIVFSDQDSKQNLHEQLNAIEKELKSSAPNKGIIKTSLLGLKKVMSEASVTFITQGIIYAINQVMGA